MKQKSGFEILDLGLRDYQEVLDLQLAKLEEIKARRDSGASPGTFILCSHPPIVTLGRKSFPEDLQGWTGPITEIARGGRATYHGPSQLVLYPVVDLSHPGLKKQRDLGWYLSALENSVISALSEFGVKSEGRSQKRFQNSEQSGDPVKSGVSNPSETGVWVSVTDASHAKGALNGARKIASLGIGIRDWITYHGVALNLDFDPTAFRGLNPCGFSPSVMIDVETLLGAKVDRIQFSRRWLVALQNELIGEGTSDS